MLAIFFISRYQYGPFVFFVAEVMSNNLTTDGLKMFSLLPEAPLRPEARGICHICHMVNPALSITYGRPTTALTINLLLPVTMCKRWRRDAAEIGQWRQMRATCDVTANRWRNERIIGGVPEVRYWTCVAQSVAAARGHRCSNHSLLVMDQETRFNETEPMTYNHRLKLPKVLISR